MFQAERNFLPEKQKKFIHNKFFYPCNMFVASKSQTISLTFPFVPNIFFKQTMMRWHAQFLRVNRQDCFHIHEFHMVSHMRCEY